MDIWRVYISRDDTGPPKWFENDEYRARLSAEEYLNSIYFFAELDTSGV